MQAANYIIHIRKKKKKKLVILNMSPFFLKEMSTKPLITLCWHELPKKQNVWPAKHFYHLQMTATWFKKWKVKKYCVLFSGTETTQDRTEFPNFLSCPLMNCFLTKFLQTSKLTKWALWVSEGNIQSPDSSSESCY